MKKTAKELEFISMIKRNGKGTEPVSEGMLKCMLENKFSKNDLFEINRLSMGESTYIASGFNSFVVKLK